MNKNIKPAISLSILAVAAFSVLAYTSVSSANAEENNRFSYNHDCDGSMMKMHQNDKASKFQRFVDDGTLTTEQRDLIVAKMQELRDSTDNYYDLSDEEKESLRESHHNELTAYAESLGIDSSIFDMSQLHTRDGSRLNEGGMRKHRN